MDYHLTNAYLLLFLQTIKLLKALYHERFTDVHQRAVL